MLGLNKKTLIIHSESIIFTVYKKNDIKKKAYIFLFLIISSLSSYAQKGFVGGYVVLNNSDTLYGKIKDRKTGSFGKFYPKIRFKHPKGGTKKYGPNNINSYTIDNSTYISMWFKNGVNIITPTAENTPNIGEKRFIRLIYSGYLSFYHLEYVNEDGNFDYTAYFKRENESIMMFVRQGLFGINKKQLVNYFTDCPELQDKIRTKTVTNPHEILEFYNDWMSKQSK